MAGDRRQQERPREDGLHDREPQKPAAARVLLPRLGDWSRLTGELAERFDSAEASQQQAQDPEASDVDQVRVLGLTLHAKAPMVLPVTRFVSVEIREDERREDVPAQDLGWLLVAK